MISKVAPVVLIAGAAFVLGRSWDSLAPNGRLASAVGVPKLSNEASRGPDERRLSDAGWRLKTFSQETNGYLDRSRLVLLELSNSEATEDSDLDVLVLLHDPVSYAERAQVMNVFADLALARGLVPAPVVMSTTEWDDLERREMLLAEEIKRDGIAV